MYGNSAEDGLVSIRNTQRTQENPWEHRERLQKKSHLILSCFMQPGPEVSCHVAQDIPLWSSQVGR